MPNLRFTASAQADLSHIIDYTIKTWGIEQSNRYVEGLESLAYRLAETPALGKYCHHLIDNIRAFTYQSHVIYYFDDEGGILVVRVLHKSMSPILHLKAEGEA